MGPPICPRQGNALDNSYQDFPLLDQVSVLGRLRFFADLRQDGSPSVSLLFQFGPSN
jgi:hypothetical protein